MNKENEEFYDIEDIQDIDDFMIEVDAHDINLRFSNRYELFAYLCEYSSYDEEYYHFSFQPRNVPKGTKCTLTFRSLERLFEYIQKYHCCYMI